MIQVKRFHTGGFVLHKVPIGNQRYSAWYGPDGSLVDAERTTNHARICPVTARQTNVRAELARIGAAYVVPLNGSPV